MTAVAEGGERCVLSVHSDVHQTACPGRPQAAANICASNTQSCTSIGPICSALAQTLSSRWRWTRSIHFLATCWGTFSALRVATMTQQHRGEPGSMPPLPAHPPPPIPDCSLDERSALLQVC